MAVRFEYIVEMEDGKTLEVTADQRDVQRYETQPFYQSPQVAPYSFLRFTAFSALDRAGVLRNGKAKMGWEMFNNTCIEVRDADNTSDEEDPKA